MTGLLSFLWLNNTCWVYVPRILNPFFSRMDTEVALILAVVSSDSIMCLLCVHGGRSPFDMMISFALDVPQEC
jgi:hypothetical protein